MQQALLDVRATVADAQARHPGRPVAACVVERKDGRTDLIISVGAPEDTAKRKPVYIKKGTRK